MPLGLVVLALEQAGDPGSLRIVRSNEPARQLGGATLATATGSLLRDALPDLYTTDLPARLAAVAEGGTPTDLGEVRGSVDRSRWYAVKLFPLRGNRVGAIFEDVTASREAEERVRRSEQQLARAQQLAGMGSWVWSIPANTLAWSDELYRIYGLSSDTFQATFEGFLERVHPDDREMVQREVRGALVRRGPFRYRERIVRPDGEVRQLDSQGDVILDASGEPVEMLGLCRDITEDERAVHALRESEERFRKIFEGSPIAICVMDATAGRLVDANPRFVELLGYGARSAMLGRTVSSLGMWTEPGEFGRLAEELARERSIRETTVFYRTYGGQVRRALSALELVEIQGRESILAMFWRT